MRIPHCKSTKSAEDVVAVAKAIRSVYLCHCRQVIRFEEEFSAYLGLHQRPTAAVTTDTAALYLALWVLGATGKNILFLAYTCSQLRHVVSMAGGIEFLCDIEPGKQSINPNIASSGDIVILPHMYGIPVRLPHRSGARFIKDAA